MSPNGGIWAAAALQALRQNLARSTQMAAKLIRSKLAAARHSAATNAPAHLQPVPVPVRVGSARQPVHPAAWLRQQKRWLSSSAAKQLNAAVRRFLSTTSACGQAQASSGPASRFRVDRAAVQASSATARAVAQLTGRAPFASTLRPNLTGGAIPRTAGGYTLGGGGSVRYFSHTPAAPAQVVQNVSQAMRAFWCSGQRARFDGYGPNGEKRYTAVSAAHDDARRKMEQCFAWRGNQPGAFIDFQIAPTITALSPLGAVAAAPAKAKKVKKIRASSAPGSGSLVFGTATLHAEGFLDVLSVDFARALQDLAAVMTDLKALSTLGDLPVSLEKNGRVLRVRFPGVDAETVERLCDDVGVRRGVVGQDPDFDDSPGVQMALRFPFAPEEPCESKLTSPGGSVRSRDSHSLLEDAFVVDEFEDNPWRLTGVEEEDDEEGYESLSPRPLSNSGLHCSEEFEGLEGIYRFLEECDRARGGFRAY